MESVLFVWNLICLGSDYLCASGGIGYTVKYWDLYSISEKARFGFNMLEEFHFIVPYVFWARF